nr:MAG TPA: hypothetical protein [Caudoviricetes sp.]
MNFNFKTYKYGSNIMSIINFLNLHVYHYGWQLWRLD